jgi:hypothetical protein
MALLLPVQAGVKTQQIAEGGAEEAPSKGGKDVAYATFTHTHRAR